MSSDEARREYVRRLTGRRKPAPLPGDEVVIERRSVKIEVPTLDRNGHVIGGQLT